jgi:Protein of unknown function (DUF3025)
MRFVAPSRQALDPLVFARPPLQQWGEFDNLLQGSDWPDVGALNGLIDAAAGRDGPRFVAQTPALLGDGLHYEQRILERAKIATRERNWHDLLNALVWLRFPTIKAGLNRRQVAEIAREGPKNRTRAQCALTHFDEAGVIVVLHDAALLALWDVHDWQGLFWRERSAWSDGRIQVAVFGHALLEHALSPGQLLVGKALAVFTAPGIQVQDAAIRAVAEAIDAGQVLNDPQELRPLPLSGIPGWQPENTEAEFYQTAACFRPLRAGRSYPAPIRVG